MIINNEFKCIRQNFNRLCICVSKFDGFTKMFVVVVYSAYYEIEKVRNVSFTNHLLKGKDVDRYICTGKLSNKIFLKIINSVKNVVLAVSSVFK